MEVNVEPSIFQFSAKFCNVLDKTKNCVCSPPLAAEIITAVTCWRNCAESCFINSDTINIPGVSNLPGSFLLPFLKLKATKALTLNYANKVYLTKTQYQLNPSLKRKSKIFSVKVETIDFSKSNDTAKQINKWVEKKTKKVKGFFHCDGFDINTRAVFVSGLYFKGIWQMKFDPENTEETIFHINNNDIVNVFLMYRKEKYNYKYSEGLEAQLVMLPFKNEEAHMLIVLPRSITGLDGVLQKLTTGYDLMAEINQMSRDIEIIVNIPRFKFESEIDLTEALGRLAITVPFDRAVQKVLIEVNETGAEPRPERMKGGYIPRWKRRPVDFTADRPHLIVVISHNIPIIWVTFRGSVPVTEELIKLGKLSGHIIIKSALIF